MISSFLCPSWAAAVLVSAPRSMSVATVLRKVCGVTQSSPVSLRAARHCRRTLCGDSQVPFHERKTASRSLGLASARRHSKIATTNFGRTMVRYPASLFVHGCR